MNLSGLTELFGNYAPWIILFAGFFLASIAIAGFLQGRGISIGRLVIGPYPGPRPSHPGDRAPTRRRQLLKRRLPVANREYTVDRAKDFYQEIAPNYDLRNSGNLVSTHLATVAQIQAIRSRRSTLRILDLGGGTGKLIAVHFFNDDAISWTYVDFCPAMAAEFRRNLAGCPLGANSTVVIEDIDRALSQLKPAGYDIILLSLVLSSMSTFPDFAPIARLLAPGGSLIITDINPCYTVKNPLYKVPIEKGVVALRTTPVDPYEVIRRTTASGLLATEHKTLGNGDTYYSFITIFTYNDQFSLDSKSKRQ